jgi:hypothetical protein
MAMKKLYLFISLSFIIVTSYGQDYWQITFEDTNYINRIWIDTSSNPSNIWQIGTPAKTIFHSAHSPTHAIVTDTLNPYPINDTSRFIVTHVREIPPWGGNTVLLLDFYFQMNSDTLSDHGIIEASIDHGITWINLMTQDTTYGFLWFEPKPILYGNTNGWTHFSLNLASLTYAVGLADTLLYRFTFVSDGIQTNKDGWIIDDFTFEDSWEGIPDIQNNDRISLFPNPTSDGLMIHNSNASSSQIIQIFNNTGQIIYHNSNFKGETIDTRQMSDGVYSLKYSNSKYISIKKFVVNH